MYITVKGVDRKKYAVKDRRVLRSLSKRRKKGTKRRKKSSSAPAPAARMPGKEAFPNPQQKTSIKTTQGDGNRQTRKVSTADWW